MLKTSRIHQFLQPVKKLSVGEKEKSILTKFRLYELMATCFAFLRHQKSFEKVNTKSKWKMFLLTK